MSRNVIVEHSRGILNTLGQPKGRGGELLFAKLIIPGDIKRELRRQLAFMNLTAITLFPGVDGLGRFDIRIVPMPSYHRLYSAAMSDQLT